MALSGHRRNSLLSNLIVWNTVAVLHAVRYAWSQVNARMTLIWVGDLFLVGTVLSPPTLAGKSGHPIFGASRDCSFTKQQMCIDPPSELIRRMFLRHMARICGG
jgi:hypothetical protein